MGMKGMSGDDHDDGTGDNDDALAGLALLLRLLQAPLEVLDLVQLALPLLLAVPAARRPPHRKQQRQGKCPRFPEGQSHHGVCFHSNLSPLEGQPLAPR